jgi:hypothetical protein
MSASVDKKIRFPVLFIGADEIFDKTHVVGLLGLGAQSQADLVGSMLAFFAIARDTGADQIFPGAFSALSARYDMVNRQFAFFAPTILALVIVPLEDIALREHYFTARRPNITP